MVMSEVLSIGLLRWNCGGIVALGTYEVPEKSMSHTIASLLISAEISSIHIRKNAAGEQTKRSTTCKNKHDPCTFIKPYPFVCQCSPPPEFGLVVAEPRDLIGEIARFVVGEASVPPESTPNSE